MEGKGCSSEQILLQRLRRLILFSFNNFVGRSVGRAITTLVKL